MSAEQLLTFQVNLNTMSKKWAAALENDIPVIEHDLKLLVGEDQIPISGHKLVLGVCSPVFRAMFSDRRKVKAEGGGQVTTTIEVCDVDFNGMANIFKYAYTGEIAVTLEDALTTMYTATKYDIPEVVDHCFGLLRSNLSADNVVTVYHSAVALNDTELMTKAKKYIVRNFQVILESENLLRLTKDNLCQVLKSDVIYAPSEIAIFKGLARWGEHQCALQRKDKTQENLRGVIGGALNHIRMASITLEDFASVIEPSNLFSVEETSKLCRYFVYRQVNRDTNVLLQELNLSTSTRKIPEKIVDLFSNFNLIRECEASRYSRYTWGVSFNIDGDEGDPPVYLRGVALAGRPSKPTENITMKIGIGQHDSWQPEGPFLCKMETSYIVEAMKTKMIDLNKSVKIVPNKEYRVYIRPTVGGVANWKDHKKDVVLYNEREGLTKPIKLAISEAYYVYTLKFSLSEK